MSDEFLAQPQVIKYRPLWDSADKDSTPAVAALL
jgi:hypothetical protein